MTHYRVMWEIDIDADTAKDAAKMALKIQRDCKSIATVFDVKNYVTDKIKRIDLNK